MIQRIPPTVIVSRHALGRYRQRVDKAATPQLIVACLRLARPLLIDEEARYAALINHTEKNCLYFYDQTHQVVYVTKYIGESLLVVTVYTDHLLPIATLVVDQFLVDPFPTDYLEIDPRDLSLPRLRDNLRVLCVRAGEHAKGSKEHKEIVMRLQSVEKELGRRKRSMKAQSF